MLPHFQNYFSCTGEDDNVMRKPSYNDVPFRFEKNFASSKIQTHHPHDPAALNAQPGGCFQEPC